MGSYDLKFDKTMASVAVDSVFIRASTDGLVTSDHEIEFAICPAFGGNTITPPSDPISVVLEVGATGTDANANFAAWTIVDIIAGCGVFDRYEITGDAATMALLMMPEPGVTTCPDIDDCNAIRVDTSNHIELSFTLTLHPVYGNSVSATFEVFVNQCLTATLTKSADPSDLVLARSATLNNIEQIALDPDYLALFVSDFPVVCPVRTLQVFDNAGAAWTDGNIALVNELAPTTARLDIDNDSPFTTTVRVQAYIALITTYFELNVEVCGDEVLTADST